MRRNVRLAAATLCMALVATGTAMADHGQGTLSGTVTDGAGSGIAGVCVTAYGMDYWYEEWYPVASGMTGADGSYSFEAPAGIVRVHFEECDDEDTGYLSEWYDDEGSVWDADDVDIFDDETTAGIDAVLTQAGSVSGTVTTVDGGARWCTRVAAYSLDGGSEASTDVYDLGSYSLDGLRPGSYKVSFTACEDDYYYAEESSDGPATADHETYSDEWYEDAMSFDSATPVTVVAGADTPMINATLDLAGGVEGTISVPDGYAADEACAVAYSPTREWMRIDYADEGGGYALNSLKPGDYLIWFGCGQFRGEWYDNVPLPGDATLVTVSAGETTSPVDADLLAVPAPDPAVTGLRVKNIPLQTDDAQLVHTGWVRRIDVDVANLGDIPGGGDVLVWVTSNTDRRTSFVRTKSVHLAAGQTQTVSIPWNGFGTIGDVTVNAEICTGWERNWRNNSASDSHYVMVGGSGFGLTGPTSLFGEYPWCGYYE